MFREFTELIQMHVMNAYAMILESSYVIGRPNITKLEWDRLVDLLQTRPYKRTKQEKDVQAMISQPESKFQDYEETADDAASIPKTHPNHKNRKNKDSNRGKQYRTHEVGGCDSY